MTPLLGMNVKGNVKNF